MVQPALNRCISGWAPEQQMEFCFQLGKRLVWRIFFADSESLHEAQKLKFNEAMRTFYDTACDEVTTFAAVHEAEAPTLRELNRVMGLRVRGPPQLIKHC